MHWLLRMLLKNQETQCIVQSLGGSGDMYVPAVLLDQA
jgi:hypothetical protein